MKIAVTCAVGWPYVRRGNRFSYELAVYLAGQGHEVHYIASKPGRESRIERTENLSVTYHRFVSHPLLSRFKLDISGSVIPSIFRSLLREDFDIVQTSFPTDGFAAHLRNKLRRMPFLYLVITCEPCYYPRVLFGKYMFDCIARSASEMISVSRYCDNELRKESGRNGVIIPPAVDLEKFSPMGGKDPDRAIILCTASVTDPRKRVGLLVKAFEKLLAVMPHAALQLAGDATSEVMKEILTSVNAVVRRAIEFCYVTSDEALVSLYRNATITVLPSLREAFGAVVAESLASGTPVVGTRAGAIPEILDDPAIGLLFEPSVGPKELCEALIKGIELARDPMTPLKCRRHVEKRYAWRVIGPQYESLYHEILEGRRRKRRRVEKRW